MNNVLIIHAFIGPVLLIIALLTKRYPPKKINMLYGYRTSRSMQNEAAWKEGNEFSATLMLRLSLGIILLQLVAITFLKMETAILISVGSLLFSLGLLIFLTERHLKHKGF